MDAITGTKAMASIYDYTTGLGQLHVLAQWGDIIPAGYRSFNQTPPGRQGQGDGIGGGLGECGFRPGAFWFFSHVYSYLILSYLMFFYLITFSHSLSLLLHQIVSPLLSPPRFILIISFFSFLSFPSSNFILSIIYYPSVDRKRRDIELKVRKIMS